MATAGEPPDPRTARTGAEFAERLLALKAWSGRSFREIAAASRKAGHRIANGTPENLTSGRGAPLERSVIGFLTGCGLTGPDQQRPWRETFAELYPPRRGPATRPPVGFDADAYLAELDQLVADSRVRDWFVPLSGYTEPGGGNVDDVEAYVDDWLERPAGTPLAVLGDYGTGKSWLCLRIAANLADRYRRVPGRPLPLLITFKRFEPRMDLEQLVRAHLFDGYGVEVRNPAELRRAMTAGHVLPILDGLDEMVKAPGERTALVAYSRLGLSGEVPRALITCRTHYFYSGSEQREMLAPAAVRPQFELLHLRLLGRDAIAECVRRRFDAADAASVLNFVGSTYNLPELCARPVLLSLVCQSHDQLPDLGGPASSADLYEAYTRAWLHRELRSGRLIVAPELVTAFFEDLAEDMVRQKTLLVEMADLKHRLTALVDRASLAADRWPEVERQLITSTFVARVHGDAWQFAHRSFQEYFYARKFFRWESETAGAGHFPVEYTPVWQFIAQMTPGRWDERKARHWIRPQIRRDADPTLTKTTLRAAAAYWLVTNRRRDFPLTGVMLDSVDLRGTDLSGCDLTGSDLHGSDLSGSDLSFAVLRDCNLTGTQFTGGDITGADFRGAQFGRLSDRGLRRCRGYDSARFR